MTVSAQTNNTTFTGNGVTTVFTLPFRFFANSDIAAYLIDPTTGASTLQVLGTNYTLVGAGLPEVDGAAQSVLTMTVAVPNLTKLYVERILPQTQTTDIVNQGSFFPEIHEDVFDRLVMLMQQTFANVKGAIRVAIGDPEPTRLPLASARANLLLSFDAFGNPIAVAPASGSATDLAVNLANASDPSKGAGQIGRSTQAVNSLTELRTLLQGSASKHVFVAGHTAKGDGGGGLYFLDAADVTSADNDGTIVVASDSGRWKFVGQEATAATFGAFGGGTIDETARLKKARDALSVVELIAGKTYAISSQIAATANGQGFICRGGKATFKMLTGAGQFDRSSYAGTNFDTNAIGLYCLGFDNYRVENVAITMEANAAVRTVAAMAVRDSDGAYVRAEAYGFQEVADGIFHIDSCINGDFVLNPHDSGTANNTLPSMQISAVNIDDQRVASVATTYTRVIAYGKNIALTGAALTTYGPQTDGVNVAGTGDNHGLDIFAKFENVGEAFDCFGSYVHAVVQGKTCAAYGVKLIHGAQHCQVDAVIDGTGGAAVVFGGSNTATQDIAYNTVRCTASGVGTIAGSFSKSAVHFDSPSATFLPRDNYVQIVIESNASMLRAVHIESGSNNVVEYTASGVQTALQVEIASSALAGNKVHRINADEGNYVTGRYYGGDYVNLSATGTLALVANTLYAIPFRVHGNLQATKIGLHVQTAVAGSARLGVYKWTEGAPGDLVLDCGTLSVGTTGDIEVSINGGNGVSLTDGMYALAVVSDVAPTIYASGASFDSVNSMGIAGIGVADNQISRAFTYAALPTPFGTATYAAASLPNLWLRA